MQKRIFYIISFIVLFITEVLIAVYVHDTIIRPFIGDVLVVILIYTFIRIFIPTGLPRLPFYVFCFAAFIEIMQYFQLADLLGVVNPVLRTILGSTFDWKDIVCYAVGWLIIVLFERMIQRR